MSVTGSQGSQKRRSTESEVDENVLHVHNILEVEGNLDSPIDINMTHTTRMDLPPLVWHHVELTPKKMKLTNTGHTLIVSAKWHQERPYVSGGPFIGNYVFSQLHFHWGKDNMEGSEHTVDSVKMPMEMHVVLFRSCYLTQESALKKKDGVAVISFFYRLQGHPNPQMQPIINEISNIRLPHKSIKLMPPLPLDQIFKTFDSDYYMYWGSVTTKTCVHSILWMFSREIMGISMEQIDEFRTLLDINEEPLMRNYRSCTEINDKTSYHIYHVSPSSNLYSTLLYFPQDEDSVPYDNSPVQAYRCEVVTQSPFKSYKQKSDKDAKEKNVSTSNCDRKNYCFDQM